MDAAKIYVRFSDNGHHIRKWSFNPFDHGTGFIRVEALPVDGNSQAGEEKLGRFGHHPEPAIDYECEVDALIGMAYERLTMGGHPDLEDRIGKAMDFLALSRPNELRWLSQTFCGTREIYATKPAWVQWPEEALAALAKPQVPEGMEGLKIARGIIDADLAEAKETGDADWIGMSQQALEALDAALSAQSGEAK